MKAIILAAGSGTRMGKYSQEIPKGMLVLGGKTLIEWQIEKLGYLGINNIIIVTGYKSKLINYPKVTYYHNPDYASTNMVESLMCARKEFDTDILVSYSDILYTKSLPKRVMEHLGKITVAVDAAWRHYWKLRFKSTEKDLESLSISDKGIITEIGKPVTSSKGLNYRYIGLIKFSKEGILKAIKLYDKKKAKNEPWEQSGKPFRQGYMTDLISELIKTGMTVYSVTTQGGWLELDTEKDYELALKLGEGPNGNPYS